MKVVVISNQAQYNKALAQGLDLLRCQVVCDNPRMREFLRAREVPFVMVDEFDIPEESRTRINSWGCNAAAAWLKVCKEENLFPDFDFASCVFLRFGYILVQMLKNFFYAREIIERFADEGVVVFTFVNQPQYPHFSGNVFLNAFLEKEAVARAIPLQRIPCVYTKDTLLRNLLSIRSIVARSLKEAVRVALNCLYTKLFPPQGATHIYVAGASRHLLPLVEELCAQKRPVALCDEEFRLRSLQYTRKKGIPYVIAGAGGRASAPVESFAIACAQAVRKSISYLSDQEELTFYGVDFSWVVNDFIFGHMNEYAHRVGRRLLRYQRVYAAASMEALVVDDDTNRNAVLVSYMKSKGVPLFCVSHATMPVNFSVLRENMTFGVSTTFVNSSFEKEMYQVRGWDPDKIKVTGIPRFDSIVKQAQSFQPVLGVRKKVRFLYCGASMKLYWPERGGYLGFHITNYGDAQRHALKSIFEAIKDLDLELLVKPHNFEGEAWPRFLQKQKVGDNVTLVPYSDDFVEVLKTCDGVIFAHWSTAMIESALFRKPMVLFDPYQSRDLAPYAQYTPCTVARTPQELGVAIKELHRRCAQHERVEQTLTQGFRSVFGPVDCESAKRVARYICEAIDGRGDKVKETHEEVYI